MPSGWSPGFSSSTGAVTRPSARSSFSTSLWSQRADVRRRVDLEAVAGSGSGGVSLGVSLASPTGSRTASRRGSRTASGRSRGGLGSGAARRCRRSARSRGSRARQPPAPRGAPRRCRAPGARARPTAYAVRSGQVPAGVGRAARAIGVRVPSAARCGRPARRRSTRSRHRGRGVSAKAAPSTRSPAPWPAAAYDRGEVGGHAAGQLGHGVAQVGDRGGDRAVGDEGLGAGQALERDDAEVTSEAAVAVPPSACSGLIRQACP